MVKFFDENPKSDELIFKTDPLLFEWEQLNKISENNGTENDEKELEFRTVDNESQILGQPMHKEEN